MTSGPMWVEKNMIVAKYRKLYNKDKILLALEINGELLSVDAQTVLGNPDLPYVSNLLKRMYANSYVKREKEAHPKGGIRYRYELAPKGMERLQWLHSRGH